MKVNKFNSLGPVKLEANEQVYNEALDYAFSKKEIKNIAITGTYGAGKSSVWETYKAHKNYDSNDVLTVILGKYENPNEGKKESTDNRFKASIDRVENQIINQILSQIKSADIPLGDYNFKVNKKILALLCEVFLIFLFISSIALLYFNESIINAWNSESSSFNFLNIFILSGILFIIPVFILLYGVLKTFRLKSFKLKIKETEASFEHKNSDGESALDRNIKEIVYLLASSQAKVLVFEDLDRFNNVDIFVKLKEFNFLVNAYLETLQQNRVVKFVYLIKDGLFYSKDRTKFFDFILPIVPILDSKTSANKFLELINHAKTNSYKENQDKSLKRSTVVDISIYVDDMRLLKNIVNEYNVYSGIVPIQRLELDQNKLFALITLKNIFPNEFELLQENKGYIKRMFDEMEGYREKLIDEYSEKFNELYTIENKAMRDMENGIYIKMADLIPDNIKIKSLKKPVDWKSYLKYWNEIKDKKFIISEDSDEYFYNFNEFTEKYISSIDSNIKDEIKKFFEKKASIKEELERKLKEKAQEEQQIRNYNYKDLLNQMKKSEMDNFFNLADYKITKDYYFPLIKFLLSSGLLDESYWYYKSSFIIDELGSLKLNDTIFVRGLFEGRDLDVFLDVESPEEIINYFIEFDFSRLNILNYKILKQCLKNDYLKYVVNIVKSLSNDGDYFKLIKVLDKLDMIECKKVVETLVDLKCLDELFNILTFSEKENKNVKNILYLIFKNNHISNNDLFLFKEILEENEMTITLVQKEEIDTFFGKINKLNVKFKNIVNLDKYILKKIEQNQAFELSVDNVITIVEKILDKEVAYGTLINDVYNNYEIERTKDYVSQNFRKFMTLYINDNQNGEYYMNDEKIVERLLKTNLPDDEKIKYLEFNKTQLSDFAAPLSDTVMAKLLSQDTIKFSPEIVSMLWWNIQNLRKLRFYNDSEKIFVKYICQYANQENISEIFNENNDLINYLINSIYTNQFIFNYALSLVDKNNKIERVQSRLEKSRLETIIKNDLILANSYNIRILINKGYFEYSRRLIDKLDNVDKERMINTLLKSNLSDEVMKELKINK